VTERIGFLLLQAAPDGQGQSPLGMLVPFAAIFVIFYFLLIRPQQKRQKAQEAMLKAVEKGDRAVTAGGAHVVVVGTTDDVLTVEFTEPTSKGDRIRFKLDRSRIERVLAKGSADKGADKKSKGNGE
jgi:preprotein translocase subunit YajC